MRTSALIAALFCQAALAAPPRVAEYRGLPTLFLNGRPNSAVLVHHWDAWPEAAKAFAERGIHLWEIGIQTSIWPDALRAWEEEAEGEVRRLLEGDPEALAILRVGLSWYPYEERFFPEIATAGDGRRWSRTHGRARWFLVGTVTEKDAPPRRWTKVVFDISKVDRKGVVRFFDLAIRGDDPHIPKGARLRFYIDQVEYFSSREPGAREVVADMESPEGILDEGRYPRPALIVHDNVKFGKGALLWEHVHDGKRGALVAKGVKWAGAARDMSRYDRLSFWIYPDTDAPFRMLVRIVGGYRRVGRPSFASDRWAADYKEMLRRLIANIERSPYGDHVIGLTLAAGLTAEWCWSGHGQVDGVDFCPAAVRKWREWLRRKYGTVGALRRAWGKDARDIRSFDQVHVPTKEERLRPGDLGEFRCPRRNRMLTDYGEFVAETTASRLVEFARTVKEASRGRLLAGALFGYLFGYGDYIGCKAQQSGHAKPSIAISSPYLDFFSAPFEYHDRALGGPTTWTLPVDSITAHGKLVINEDDLLTHLTKTSRWLAPRSLEESVEVMEREAAASIVKGHGWWWFLQGLGGPRLWETRDGRAILETAGALKRVADEALRADRRSASEVAVITDRRGFLCLHPQSQLPGLIFYQTPELMRMGAPFDIYLLDDVDLVARKDYKVVLLFNCFWVDRRAREAIRRLKSEGRTLVFTYATGIIGDELDVENVAELTGIGVRADLRRAPARVRVTDTSHPITAGLPEGYTFGGLDRDLPAYGQMPPSWYPKQPSCSPILYADEPRGKVLGVMTANGRPGLVVRDFGSWRSVWVGAYTVSAPVLRGILRFAGVHIYDDAEDIVYANRGFLAIHFSGDGERTIRLPRPRTVVDALTGRALGRNVSTIKVRARFGETRVFRLL